MCVQAMCIIHQNLKTIDIILSFSTSKYTQESKMENIKVCMIYKARQPPRLWQYTKVLNKQVF